MEHQATTNSLINDIMSNETSAAMLFAPAGAGKTDFISDLSTRYQTVYWFNALTDDVEEFSLCLCEKILGQSQELLRIKQLIYSRSEFNNQNIVLTALLQHISRINNNCLMVFERMEMLHKKFDYSLLERLIKHSPNNLKIIISSDKFINLDYTLFEPKYPKLIDETLLSSKALNHDFESYIEDLTDDDVAFLCYISDLDYADSSFVQSIYSNGIKVLQHLSRKECFVCARDNTTFRLNTLFRNWLITNADKYKDLISKYGEVSSKMKFGQFIADGGNFYYAFKIFNSIDNIEKADECIKNIITDKMNVIKLRAYSEHNGTTISSDMVYNYYDLYRMMVHESKKDYDQVLNCVEKMIDRLKETDMIAYFLVCAIYVRISIAMGHFQRAFEDIRKIRLAYEKTRLIDIEDIICHIPRICKEIDVSIPSVEISEYEKAFIDPQNDSMKIHENQLWYIKGLEVISEIYFYNGNYKKAMQITSTIKSIIPFYVIPHNMILFYYYSGEVDNAEKIATEALQFALKHDINKDLSLLYTTLANIDMYYGRIKEALSRYDLAISLDKEDNYTKFYNISQRCIAYCRFGKIDYAREVAHIYLKFCQTYCPQYANMMLSAMALCFFKSKEYEKAYRYANEIVRFSKTKSVHWLLGMSIATNYLLQKNDLRDATTLIKNIIKASYVNGMEIMIIDNIDIFEPMFDFASEHEIETEFLNKVYKSLNRKKTLKETDAFLKIKFFGTPNITASGKEIVWKTRKSKELFFQYIVAGENGLERQNIIELLWRDYLYESAINNLKTTNNIIRKTLKEANIDFVLDYTNCKYVLKIKNYESDLLEYKRLVHKINLSNDVYEQKQYLDGILKIYGGEFAKGLPNFGEQRKRVRSDVVYNLLRVSKSLAKQRDFIEARKFVTALISVDKENDYTNLLSDIDNNIVKVN